jgi:diguanylate cyclase (GGDEF)-like protein/PAS domain S-box-containing protein
MNERDAEYFRFRRKLLVGYLVLCGLLFSLLAWKITAGYQADRDAAIAVTENSARSMAAHVEELINAVDQPLRISALGIAGMDGKPVNPASIQPLLAASSLASDSRFWLLFIDAAGKGVVASNGLAVHGVSYADRSYFRDPAAMRADKVHVGGSADGRVSNRKLFFLSRRVESRSGKFLGVVAAPVDAWRIANVFEKARLDAAMSIALTTRDNVVVARAPLFQESFGVDLSRVRQMIPPARSVGGFEAASPFSGERRLYAYAPVGSFPLRVTVGITRESWMAGVRSDLLAGLVGLGVALTVAWFSGRFALDQFRRLARVERAQRKLIAQLGAAKEVITIGERRLRIIADSVPAQVAYINADERYTFHNDGECGAPIGALMGNTLLETHGPEIYALLKDDVERALKGERVRVEHSYAVNGEMRCFKHEYTPDTTVAGKTLGFYSTVTDITDFKTIQNRLSALARADPLTGLPNRAELLDRLETSLVRCRRTGGTLACLYLDIDRFKEVNDTLGHSGGDSALVEFSRRLRQCVRESDTVARLAGDEFVIALEDIDQPSGAEVVAAKIIASMAVPFHIDGVYRVITTSVGLVIARPLQDDPRSLLRAADEALYRAKRAGRNRIESHFGTQDI